MLAVDFVIVLGAFFFTVFVDSPRLVAYTHLLVTYHFGFVRRALVGTVLSWFTEVVPLWYVYAIGTAAWIATLILFVAAFRKVFGFDEKKFPLFVFLIGSPFFFKNFVISIGHFDIYGCLWALVALLIPAGPLYPLFITGGCIGLILMHHLHFLLYIPTIGFIVFVRYGVLRGFSAGKAIYGLVLVLLLLAAFVATAFFGRMPVPPETFLAYIRARASDPIDGGVWIWNSTITEEIKNTWDHMGMNIIRVPVYAALIALHIPVASYFKSMIVALPTPLLRTVTIAALVAISVGYLAICVVTYDYSRWVSNWAVCMFLAMHAVRLLPTTAKEISPPIRPDSRGNLLLGWIVTVIPRVGVTIPF